MAVRPVRRGHLYLATFWFFLWQDVLLSDKNPSGFLPANRDLAPDIRCVRTLTARTTGEYRNFATQFLLMTAKRNRIGRPPMTEGRRNKKIDARFTEDEYKTVLDLEKTLGVSRSDLIRTRLLENAPHVLINAKELIMAIDTIGSELGRAGNNINQLARYANILQKRGRMTPDIIAQFNVLLSGYLENQQHLAITLRKIIRLIGR